MHRVRKRYGHEQGLSAIFRQPNAASHCREPHGYPLSFEFILEADILDDNHWVSDFGGFKPVKAWLCETFDHRLLLSVHDPAIDDLCALYAKWGWQPPIIVPNVGCEGFAELAWEKACMLIPELQTGIRVRLHSVECREHAGNAAVYYGDRK